MSDGPDPVELARRIRPALTRLYVSYFRTADHSELTGPQLSIMHRLQETGPCRIRQLAEAEGVQMPTASNSVNLLERRGLVQRSRVAADRRGVTVELTDLGRQVLERVGEERTQSLAAMLATLAPEELASLTTSVDAINALARSYNAAEPDAKRGQIDHI